MLGKQKRQNKQSNTQTYLKGSAQICCRNLYLGQNFFLCPQLVWKSVQFSSVAQSCPTLWPHGLQHSRLPCLSPTPQSCSNSCPVSRWCHPTISSSVIPFSCLHFPSIRVFSSESVLHNRWPKYWSFSFSISPSNESSGLISLKKDWLDLLAVQGTLKSLFQHHSSKAHSSALSFLYSLTLISIHDYWRKHRFDSMDLRW